MKTYATETALSELGVTKTTLLASEKDRLDRDGYVVLEGILSPTELEGIRARLEELLELEKENAGKEVHQEEGTARLANLVDKGPQFRVFFTHPRVLAALAHVLKQDMQLSALNSRAALPGRGAQALHVDAGKLGAGEEFKVCNSGWLLDDFTADNGPTRVVPGSHHWRKFPEELMKDPAAPHPDEKLIVAPAGSVVVFNSHLWHGGTVNRTSSPRRAVFSYWSRRGPYQQTDQSKFLSEDTKAGFSPAERFLLKV